MGRDPLLVWFTQSERIMTHEEQAAALDRARRWPQYMSDRSRNWWLAVNQQPEQHPRPRRLSPCHR